MSSRRGGGKAIGGGDLGRDVSIDSTEGEWEVIGKRSKNRAGSTAKLVGSSTSSSKAWGGADGLSRQGFGGAKAGAWKDGGVKLLQSSDPRRPAGMVNSNLQPSTRRQESVSTTSPHIVTPPLQNGWQWNSRNASAGSKCENVEGRVSETINKEGSVHGYDSEPEITRQPSDDGSEDDECLVYSDDDLSDEYDSDASKMSHETRKQNKWFRTFFKDLDMLTIEEISEQARQWHCPACRNGPGAIDWYKGLQPLVAHAKTKGATRVKLHRELAELLEEELCRKGASVIPAGEAFDKWKGLCDTQTDRQIIWPPMVIIMNTKLDKDEHDKWVGMGNQELLEYFNQYAAQKARHSYGPQGHRGMSLLIFEATAIGYLEAERLHKHFSEEGRDRHAWKQRPSLFYPGGKRQLYGYLARKEDMDNFNQHCQGKARLKFETKSYQDMVVEPLKQMSEENQQLIWYKNKVAKQEKRTNTLEETFGAVSQKLRQTMEENMIVRLRTKIQHEENKHEMDYQENFFKEQISKVHKAMIEKEKLYERLLQQERFKAKEFELNPETNDDQRLRRKAESERFIDSQVKGVQEFEAEREKLMRAHQEKKDELKRKFLADQVELEKEFDTALTMLMEKFTPSKFFASSS